MPLEPDIVKKLKEDFSPEDAGTAAELLDAADRSGRIARCIVVLADGRLELLWHYMHAADQDYRDVIYWAEYDGKDRHVRDLRASFLIDSPEKMWISAIADTLQRRGYSLTSIETVPASGGVAAYRSGLGEGVATFEGDLGPITVTKQQGQWALKGHRTDLQAHNLSTSFSDEQEFADAVSGYILAKRANRR